MVKLSGKIAVVTGGTGSLGTAVVEKMLNAGATVITTHTGRKTSIDDISSRQKAGMMIDGRVVNVASESSVESLYDDILAKYRRVDILCNLVGGVGNKKTIEEIPLAEWETMFELNLTTCFLMMRRSLREMKKNGFGRVINIASMPAVIPEAERGGYAVAKAGVIALTKLAAEEVKEFRNITVNAIAPSIIATDENRKWGSQDEMKKWVTPDQIAEMIAHLCSESGAAVNGQVLNMFGKV